MPGLTHQWSRQLSLVTLLARLKQDYRVDEMRVYATGHSNGGSFTHLLWAERGVCLPPRLPRPPWRAIWTN